MTYYTKDHEWLRVEGDVATVGVTGVAAKALGDLVFIEVKPVGAQLRAQEPAAVVESVKAASDVYAPLAGEIIEINPRLADEPAVVNDAPEGEGWLFRLRIADPSELDGLLDPAAYAALAGDA